MSDVGEATAFVGAVLGARSEAGSVVCTAVDGGVAPGG
jgi:hypothetical protein